MANYAAALTKGDVDSTATGTVLIDKNSIRKYSSVTKFAGGWRYSTNDDVVHGSLYGVSSGLLQIAVHGPDIKFKNGTAASLGLGLPILGSTRNNIAGFVKSAICDATVNKAEIDRLLKARGTITNGGAAHATLTDTTNPADVEVALSYGLTG